MENAIFQDFQDFFACCVGNWVTERTYHYLTNQEVERSRTEFNRVSPEVPQFTGGMNGDQ